MSRTMLWRKRLPLIAVGALLMLLIVCPLLTVFAQAVIVDGRLDFSNAIGIITNLENLTPILNSIWLGVWVVIISTIIALPLAFILSRTTIANHKWIDIVLMIPFMTPPYIGSMGWILFMQKRGLLEQLFPTATDFSNIFFTFSGLVVIMALHVFPFMLSMLKNALLNIGSGIDEAAQVSGANWFYRLKNVFLPLLKGNYAIGALLVFVKTISEYGTPATFGRRIGFDVFTTEIHRYSTTSPINFGKSAALSAILIGICLTMWYIQNYISNKNSFRLVSGKGIRLAPKKLNSLTSFLSWGYIVFILAASIGIPYFSVVATSLIKLRGNGLQKGNFTFNHYVSLFTENPKGISAIVTSLTLAILSATICAIIGTVIAIVIKNSTGKSKKITEAVSLLPEMLPGIVLVIGLMLFWNKIYKLLPLYNTFYMMVVTYVVLFLPYTVQYVTSSLGQISFSLTEAAKVLGGSAFFNFRKITVPLVIKGVATGWSMTFIISFRELVAASMVAPPSTLTISTFIVREFEQGSVSVGMAMAVICVILTTGILLTFNLISARKKG